MLLLREMKGCGAEARVEPGLQVSEADVIVTVRAEGSRVEVGSSGECNISGMQDEAGQPRM